MDPVFSGYGYTQIRKNRDPCVQFKSKYLQIHNSSIAATEIVEELIRNLRRESLLFGGDILDITQLLKRFRLFGLFAFL